VLAWGRPDEARRGDRGVSQAKPGDDYSTNVLVAVMYSLHLRTDDVMRYVLVKLFQF
jgi:hypothetical protein